MTPHQPKLIEFPGGNSGVTLLPPPESFTFDGAGNAIVPQIALEIFRAIDKTWVN
jgi:hypothetical protein